MGIPAHEAGLPYARPKRHGIAGASAWTALASAFLVALAAVLAILLKPVFLFVSLGPIVFEQIERPLARASSPRSTIVGNAIALLVGYSALAIFGLQHHPSTVQEGVTIIRACAVVFAIGITAAMLVLLRASHPPASATALLVALGIFHRPLELLLVFATIVGVTILANLLNRAAGIPVPSWASSAPAPYDDPEPTR